MPILQANVLVTNYSNAAFQRLSPAMSQCLCLEVTALAVQEERLLQVEKFLWVRDLRRLQNFALQCANQT